jgi:CRP-like cAMP-binding protein
MQQKRLKMLQNMPVFGGIDDNTLEFLVEQAQPVTVAADAFFFREQEQGSAMFVLETGTVAVVKTWQEQDYLLAELGPGDCFGELALIDFYPRSASVRALEDCSAIELSNSALYQLYEKDLKQFTLIQMNMGREVSRRLRAADEQLFQEQIKNNAGHQQRVIYFI